VERSEKARKTKCKTIPKTSREPPLFYILIKKQAEIKACG
jgi:hypothetical protein